MRHSEITDLDLDAALNGLHRERYGGGGDSAESNSHAPTTTDDIPQVAPVPFAQLRQQYPQLHAPVIDGLIRQGETMNIISASKVGKSWLSYDLALSIISGRRWLDLFSTAPGCVLLIDNELHQPTIASRIPKVADARGISLATYGDSLHVLSLRGYDVSVLDLGPFVESIGRDYYTAIILDAWYRAIPSGLNENSNSDVMSLYNRLDRYADLTGAAWIVVHHSSKGEQGGKSVTDVGAGAGSQSRAADSHVVLRQHEEDGCVVMEGAVRSFPPIAPIGLRWEFPVWNPAYALDTDAIKGRRTVNEERQERNDADGIDSIRKVLADGPATPRQIRDRTGFGNSRTDRLLGLMFANEIVTYEEIIVRGNSAREYKLTQ